MSSARASHDSTRHQGSQERSRTTFLRRPRLCAQTGWIEPLFKRSASCKHLEGNLCVLGKTGILTLYTSTLPCKWWLPFILVEKAMFQMGKMYLVRSPGKYSMKGRGEIDDLVSAEQRKNLSAEPKRPSGWLASGKQTLNCYNQPLLEKANP